MNFLNNFEGFLIQESVKQAKQFLETISDDVSDDYKQKVLSYLTDLLKKNPNLIGNFVKYHFNENIPLYLEEDKLNEMELDNIVPDFRHSLELFIKYYQQYKQQLKNYLPKDIINYDKFEELIDDIARAKDDITIRNFVKPLKGDLRRSFDNNDQDLKTYILTYLSKLQDPSIEEDKKPMPLNDFYKKSSSFATVEDMKRFLKKEISSDQGISDYEKEVRHLLDTKYKKSHDVIYDDNGVLIISMFDKDGIKELGGNWCIVTNQDYHYDSYCNPVNGWTQYLAFDFNKLKKDPKSLFGISIDEDGETKWGAHQDRSNNEISLSGIMESLGIDKPWREVFKPIYVGIKDKYSNRDISSYKDFVSMMKEIDDDGYGEQLKKLIAEKFDFTNFVRNLMKGSKSWDDFFNSLNNIEDETFLEKTGEKFQRESTRYENLKQYIEHFEDFESDDPEKVNELLDKHSDKVDSIPGMSYFLTKGLGLKDYLDINSQFFKSIANNEESLKTYVKELANKTFTSNQLNSTFKYLEKLGEENEDMRDATTTLIKTLASQIVDVDMGITKEIAESGEENVIKFLEENPIVLYLMTYASANNMPDIHRNTLKEIGIKNHTNLLNIINKFGKKKGFDNLLDDIKSKLDLTKLYKDYFVELSDVPKIYDEAVENLNGVIPLSEFLNQVYSDIISKETDLTPDKMDQLMEYIMKADEIQ
jgi:hypothetical protein